VTEPQGVAAFLEARNEAERGAALAALAARGSLGLLEGALPDIARTAPEALALVAKLAGETARRDDPAARRLLDLLAGAGSDDARLAALAALRAGEAGAREPGPFAAALAELAAGLPPSPLREKLARVAQAGSLSPEVVAKAFAAAYEAARAAQDERLILLARERLAPALEAHGLAAVFEREADEAAFDVRPASGGGAAALGRPAVRARGGAVVVRGVVFAPAAPVESPESALAALVRAALAPGATGEAREAALLALARALTAKLSSREPGASFGEVVAAALEAVG
jgi:hypothetical protein